MINLIGYTINEMGLTLQLLAEYTGRKFKSDLGNLVVIIVSAAGALMTLYAIYIAYLFFTASDANKRKAARERLVKTIASVLIIVGLASVLSVINVTFNKAEGRIDGPSSGSNTNYSSVYSYNAVPTLKFVKGQPSQGCYVATGSFSLSAKDIVMNGVTLDEKENTVRFQKCHIVSPAWSVLNENFSIDSVGEATYTCSLKSEQQYSISIRCNKKNESSYITVAVTFVMENDPSKELSFNVDVFLDKDSNQISFIQG